LKTLGEGAVSEAGGQTAWEVGLTVRGGDVGNS
jgi:hypothetical protein